MGDDDVTLGEVSRSLEKIATRLENTATSIDSTYLRRDVYAVEHEILQAELKAIRERSVWLFRTVVTALVVAGATALFAWVSYGGH